MPDPVILLASAAGQVTTTDATVTTAASLTFPANCGGLVRVEVIARDTANGDVVFVDRRILVKSDATTLSVVGSPTTVASGGSASLAACVVSLDGSGLTGRVRVTGISGKSISWLAQIQPNIVA